MIRPTPHHSLRHHHLDKFLIVDLTVTINICFTNHFIYLLVGEFFPEIGHDMAQLCRADESIPITIENFEGFDEFLFGVCILHFSSHERQELGEIDRAVSICVHFVYHVLELSLRWILPQGSHHGAELLRGDGAIAILVKEREGLLELCDLLLSQLVSHGYSVGCGSRGDTGSTSNVSSQNDLS